MKTTCSECGKEFPFGTLGRCAGCEGILQPVYSDQTVRTLKHIRSGAGIDRYRSLMPVSTPIPFLGEGNTPLIPSRRIGPSLGLKHLCFKEAFEMQRRLAFEEGIWVEPAAVVSVTSLRSLVEQGWLKPHERVVCLLTGAGFKDSKLSEAEAEAISRQNPVPFDVKAIVAEVHK
jgi:threonine synthase